MRILIVFAALFVAAPARQTQEGLSGILAAVQLPALVTEARSLGVAEQMLGGMLDGLLRRALPADEAAAVFRHEVDAVHAGGERDNFGAFVQRHLDAGLRGRDLADAIQAEHRRLGVGRPDRGGRPARRDTTGTEGGTP